MYHPNMDLELDPCLKLNPQCAKVGQRWDWSQSWSGQPSQCIHTYIHSYTILCSCGICVSIEIGVTVGVCVSDNNLMHM